MFFAAGTAGPGIRKVPISPHDLCDSGVTIGAEHGVPWGRMRSSYVRRRVLAFVASLHATSTPPAAAAATCLAVAVVVCCFCSSSTSSASSFWALASEQNSNNGWSTRFALLLAAQTFQVLSLCIGLDAFPGIWAQPLH